MIGLGVGGSGGIIIANGVVGTLTRGGDSTVDLIDLLSFEGFFGVETGEVASKIGSISGFSLTLLFKVLVD